MIKKEKNSNVTIIGLGQIGLMFLEQLRSVDGLNLSGVARDHQLDLLKKTYPDTTFFSLIDSELVNNSDVFIVAVGRKGLPKVIKEMNVLLATGDGQTTILLIQNGVLSADNINLGVEQDVVRGSVFTVVNKQSGKVRYKKNRLRISIAQIQGKGVVNIHELMQEADFKTETVGSWRSMEITKLLMNTIGTTGVVTGLSLSQTFENKELFALEVKAMKDRMSLIKAANLELYNFWRLPIPAKLLGGIFQHMPLFLLSAARNRLGKIISGERGDELSAAATQVNEGHIPKELDDYHSYFLSLATELGMESPIDKAIVKIVKTRTSGLKNMESKDRVKLLLLTVGAI